MKHRENPKTSKVNEHSVTHKPDTESETGRHKDEDNTRTTDTAKLGKRADDEISKS